MSVDSSCFAGCGTGSGVGGGLRRPDESADSEWSERSHWIFSGHIVEIELARLIIITFTHSLREKPVRCMHCCMDRGAKHFSFIFFQSAVPVHQPIHL